MKSRIKLAVWDIDGTLRRKRSPWKHLHEYLGVYEQAKDFFLRWERGEISYETWAHLDASLWKGFSRERMQQALQLNPLRDGAVELVRWFVQRKIPCVGISSGLSIFNTITATLVGMDKVVCNQLHFEDDICTGRVTVQVTEDNKGEIFKEMLSRYSVSSNQVVAFGDGDADIPLLKMACLGIAICPSNKRVQEAAMFSIEEEPIDRAIELIEQQLPHMTE